MPSVEVPDEVASEDADGPPDVDAPPTAPPSPPSPVGPSTAALRRPPVGSRPAAPASTDDDSFAGIDWTGRGAEGGSDDHHDAGPGAGSAGGSGTRRLAVVAGVVSFAYVAWVIIDLVVLALSGTAYTTMHEALDSLAVRLVLCGAWLALLFHGLDGLRIVLADLVPPLRVRDRGARAVVVFVLFATWIPTALVLLWPSVRGWFA